MAEERFIKNRFIENPPVREVSDYLVLYGQDCPEDHHRIYTMQTAQGLMSVVKLTGLNHGIFCAHGFIDGRKSFVVGHISTLSITCVFESDLAPGRRYGFTAS